MSTEINFKEIIEKLNQLDLTNRKRGSIFEILSKHLLKENDTSNSYKKISLWSEWEHRGNLNDNGIDIIIETNNNEFIAVQCKFFDEDSKISFNKISTFLSQLQSGIEDIKFSKGIIITTSTLTDTSEKQIAQIRKNIPIDLITIEDFINSNIDWINFNPKEQNLPLKNKRELREHQKQALELSKKYFSKEENTRGKLIMACGTGKTFTSLRILENITENDSIILFLAPSIALVGQTFREYNALKEDPFVACIVCSDSKSGQSEDDLDFNTLPYSPSTDYQDILKAYKNAQKSKCRFIIFSTYQSSYNIKIAQENGLKDIDLIICDEAHRTVGAMFSNTYGSSSSKDLFGDSNSESLNSFTLCHSDDNIKAKKRLYMTATPKVYSEKSRAKANEKGNEIYSMDDEEIYGSEIYSINFSQAVSQQLLTDYKVIILAIKSESVANITNNSIVELKSQNTDLNHKLIDHDFVCKIIGTHKGLSKKDLITLDENNNEDEDFINEMDRNPSRRAISFCRNIATSKNITKSFETIIKNYDKELESNSFDNLNIYIDHIDGTMDSKIRLEKLTQLNNPVENTCNILSNARCLSEGVDVPALDTVIFFDGRSAMVDIIQAVGRVMRKAPNKEIGYIILPIALTQNEINNLDQAVQNTNFQNIWNILKALRSHDPSLVDEAVFRDKIKIAISDNTSKETDPKKKDKKSKDEEDGQYIFNLQTLQDIANSIYNVMPTKLGDKGYWQSFSAKTAKIAESLNIRLKSLFEKNEEVFNSFLEILKENIHSNIKDDEAIDMICSHIITKPIFDALFGDNSNKNPISNALDEIVEELHKLGLDDEETHDLTKLYNNVKENAKLAKSQKSKQELIKNLYDTFLKTAFKKQSEKLGVVYTPIEVVDFILHSTNILLKKHFNKDFNNENVKIFDPFTGTGSFISRLLSKDNNLISDESLENKYNNELFAQDIILLAYYISLINITDIANNRNTNLKTFENIALTDSLDYFERKEALKVFNGTLDLEENKRRKDKILNEKITVIVSNPPYFSGAKDQNDNNANIRHPILEEKIKNTYGKYSSAQLAKNTRDTLVQSIYMSSKRLEDKGVIGFVVNGSFIDATSADGFRKALYEEFADIYIINLRGNQRTAGEESRKEGGKIFGSGSRASVAIIFLVKDISRQERNIHYYDIGDYLSREEKLEKIKKFRDISNIEFNNIIPNEYGDWINQRKNIETWNSYLKLKQENKNDNESIFIINGTGVVTGRDSWTYNFNRDELRHSMEKCINTYNEDLKKFNYEEFKKKLINVKNSDYYTMLDDNDITTDKTKIAWTNSLKNKLIKKKRIDIYNENNIRVALYRPFMKEYFYYNKEWNERQSQFKIIFPQKHHENLIINISDKSKSHFDALVSNLITSADLLIHNQVYPLYMYDEFGNKNYAISEYALSTFKNHYNDTSINEEDIFYYIYGIFHHKKYLEDYKNELAKEAPRIPLSKDFRHISKLGKELADIHINYEEYPKYNKIEYTDALFAEKNSKDFYDVIKMKKIDDGRTIIYNKNINIINIPSKAYQYTINNKSAIDWIIERYQVSIDKDSNIPNNPNLYDGGKYIFDLLCSIINLSMKSVEIIDEISKLDYE